MEAMSFSKAVAEMDKVVESAPANKPVRWDHWSKVIGPLAPHNPLLHLRRSSAAGHPQDVGGGQVQGRRCQPQAAQDREQVVAGPQAELDEDRRRLKLAKGFRLVVASALFFFLTLPWLLIHSRAQAASDKRIAELKAVLNEINGRKGGREMTIDEVLMLQSSLCSLRVDLFLCLRAARAT